MHETWIRPDWPAPACVHAVTTTRAGGLSRGGYASLNLADHVGDDLSADKVVPAMDEHLLFPKVATAVGLRAIDEGLARRPLDAAPLAEAAGRAIIELVLAVIFGFIADAVAAITSALAPTFHGDTIHAETRVLEVKESSSKPDRGVVTVETKGFNQDGKEVCYFKRKVLIWKREFAPERKRPYDGTDVWAD